MHYIALFVALYAYSLSCNAFRTPWSSPADDGDSRERRAPVCKRDDDLITLSKRDLIEVLYPRQTIGGGGGVGVGNVSANAQVNAGVGNVNITIGNVTVDAGNITIEDLTVGDITVFVSVALDGQSVVPTSVPNPIPTITSILSTILPTVTSILPTITSILGGVTSILEETTVINGVTSILDITTVLGGTTSVITGTVPTLTTITPTTTPHALEAVEPAITDAPHFHLKRQATTTSGGVTINPSATASVGNVGVNAGAQARIGNVSLFVEQINVTLGDVTLKT